MDKTVIERKKRYLLVVLFIVAGLVYAPESGRLQISCEPKKTFIIGSSEEGESIVFNVNIENGTDDLFTVEKLFIGFKKDGQLILEKEQPESFFNQGLIIRQRKIRPESNIKWTGICLTSESFGQVDEIMLSFQLKGRNKLRTTQSLQIPVARYLQKTTLRLPFRGRWKVEQGHRCRSNHRISGYGGDFAWDFAALGPKGNAIDEKYYDARENRYVYAFGSEVLAPASGKIARIKNDVQDNAGEREYPRKSYDYEARNPLWVFGNFVIIDHKNGEFSLLAHLMKGSITMSEGNEVKAGDVIGRCGNSGNTMIPHIHYQLMDGDYPNQYTVKGLPALFSNYTVLKPPTDFSEDLEPKNLFMTKENVTNGDPEQDTIIEVN